jgi:hypothetical protein
MFEGEAKALIGESIIEPRKTLDRPSKNSKSNTPIYKKSQFKIIQIY